jgi:hypothetical protein
MRRLNLFLILCLFISAEVYSQGDKSEINEGTKQEETFKDIAIKYIKKWTYWDYIQKTKLYESISASISNLKESDKIDPTKKEDKKELASDAKIEEKSISSIETFNKVQAKVEEYKPDSIPTLIVPNLPDEFESTTQENHSNNTAPSIDLPDLDNNKKEEPIPNQEKVPSLPELSSSVELPETKTVADSIALSPPHHEIKEIGAAPATVEPTTSSEIENLSPTKPDDKITESIEKNNISDSSESLQVDAIKTTNIQDSNNLIKDVDKDLTKLVEQTPVPAKNENEESQKKAETHDTSANTNIENNKSELTTSANQAEPKIPESIADAPKPDIQEIPAEISKDQNNKLTPAQQADLDILLSEGKTTIQAKEIIDYRTSKTPEELEKEEKELAEKNQFIQDELTMLIMPEDDIELGKLTLSAKLTYSDDSEFFKIFWENFDSSMLDADSVEIRKYIYNLKRTPVLLKQKHAKELILDSIKKGDISTLRAVLNHTANNLVTYRSNNFNLLQSAINSNDYNNVYYIIMRGQGQINFDNIKRSTSPSINWLIDRHISSVK